jgi:energy-coupling factor transporter ATP-binding protein EcfA2
VKAKPPSGSLAEDFHFCNLSSHTLLKEITLILAAPKGAIDSVELAISLKRYPDTKRQFSAACYPLTFNVMTKPIVILSGPVGAGKSTVAQELIALSPDPIAYIEGDTFWSFIAKGAKSRRIEKNFKMIMTAMTGAALPYALYGYEVILDFSIPPWFLETAQKIVKSRDVPLDYVVLRPSETVCAARAAARPEGAIADYAPYRDLYSSFDGAARYTIKDDASDAAVVAARMREGLDSRKFRVS